MHGNNIYIKDMWVVNLAFPDFIRDYLSRLDYNGYTEDCRCYFEPKASGISIVQQLREKTTPKGLVVNAMQDAPPTESKLSRLKAVSPMVESGRVHLLDGAHWIESFMQEIMTFPNAKHDDQVDAFVSALKLCQNQTNITII
jgi:predicted phage terminase large subunit-like protein